MLIKIPLLENANSTTPGTPVQIGGTLVGAFLMRFCSATYTAGAAIDIAFERAEYESGPWESTPVAVNTIPQTGLAGEVVMLTLPSVPIIWLRARLSAAPSAGDVDVNLYVEA